MIKKSALFILLLTTAQCSTALAIETAPRISDREIIESLADLRATQKILLQRFEGVDRRFEDINKRFELIDKRFEQVDKRFEQVDKRLDDMSATNRMFFGFVMSTLLALFGYIVWDRRTLMKPLEERIFTLEREIDVGGTEGTKVSRLVKTLRELSREDDKVANILKQFHLL